ncbi:MAG: acyltransferase family protein [Blastochloris sp.]|nr:acyltransferase family protein [Blastochloris sp.]
MTGQFLSLAISESSEFVGNGTWQSVIYALWDSTVAVGMFLAAITFFRGFFDRESRFGSFLSRQSYAVYILHTPIIVFLALALRGVALNPIPKFVLVSAITVPLCCLVAAVVRRVPPASRILLQQSNIQLAGDYR